MTLNPCLKDCKVLFMCTSVRRHPVGDYKIVTTVLCWGEVGQNIILDIYLTVV